MSSSASLTPTPSMLNSSQHTLSSSVTSAEWKWEKDPFLTSLPPLHFLPLSNRMNVTQIRKMTKYCLSQANQISARNQWPFLGREFEKQPLFRFNSCVLTPSYVPLQHLKQLQWIWFELIYIHICFHHFYVTFCLIFI